MSTRWQISVHPMGIVCLIAALVFIPIEKIVAAMIAVLLHEAAHMLAIRLCHIDRCRVEWTPFGFVAQAEGFSRLKAWKRALIAASGLFCSGLTAAVCYPWCTRSHFVLLLFLANLALLVINALPVLPLDGGRVLVALAAYVRAEAAVGKILRFLSYLAAFAITLLGLYGTFCGEMNPTLLVLGPYLAYAARQSTLQSGIESVQLLTQRAQLRRSTLLKAEPWMAIGPADPLATLKLLRRTPTDRYVLMHTIDPATGSLVSTATEDKMIVNLLEEPTNHP